MGLNIDEQQRLLRILIDGIMSIPADKIERNPTIVEEISNKLTALKQHFQIRKDNAEADVLSLTKEIMSLTDYVSYVKKTM